MSEELKPCPFCGSKTLEVKCGGYCCEYVYCRGCETTGPDRMDEAAAIEAWNRRVPAGKAVTMEPADIKRLALLAGFTERAQPNGTMDLNPYVYAFGLACHRAGQDQTDGRIAELESEIERLEHNIMVTNQAKADFQALSLRRLKEIERLREFIEMWLYEGALQTFESREKFRREGRELLSHNGGFCTIGEKCRCGGDNTAVRAGCLNWVST